jgi:D-alanyl-D-alanine carboxypeptidase
MRLRNTSGLVCNTSGLCQKRRPAMSAAWLALAAILMAGTAQAALARVHSSIMLDVQTGKVLEARNPDSLCYPASLTKLMTLYLTFRQLNSRKMTLGQELRVSSHAAAQQPTKLYLKPGEEITVRSAILAITTRSANDAAVVLAEAVGGTEYNFAQMMTQQARELGMTRTTFRNASGLPNRHQKTTARDMAKLALAILHDYPQYYDFFKAREFNFQGRTIYGHDHLLARYPGVDGMKTGYTVASGFNIVTSAVRHDRRLLGVVMGGRTARSRDHLMMALLNRGFAQARRTTLTAEARNPDAVHEPVARYKDVSQEETDAQEADRPDLGWLVQLGGKFRSSRHVRNVLRSARRTTPEPLKGARPLVVKLRGGRYLARFADLDESTAIEACSALRRRKFTCNAYQVRRSGLVLASATTR